MLFLAGCFYIKIRVKRIEVLGIQPVGHEAESFSETLEMNDFAFPQETDRITYFRIFDHAENIVVSCAGFLLCCDAVRTALRLLPRLGSVSLDGG